MKASAEKSSTTTSPTATRAANEPFFAKANGGNFFAPVTGTSAPVIQMKMAVNKPGDKFEQEADKMANKVMRMPAPSSPVKEEKLQRQADEKLQKKEEERIQKAPLAEEKLQRRGDGTPAVGASTQTAIRNKTTGGQPLSSDVRSFMEPRFGADFSNVRIHSDTESAGLSNQLSARAFTYQNHVFFSRDQYQPGTSEGKQLLAHELTHTVQQGQAVQRSPQISTTTAPSLVQRRGFDDLWNYFSDRANLIPGFRMFTIILGINPITMASVDRSPANIMRAAVEFMPGGVFITQALDNHGVFNRVADWVAQQIHTLAMTGSAIRHAIESFISRRALTDIFDLPRVWDEGRRIFTEPVDRIISFVRTLAIGVLQFIKDAILMPLARLAEGTRGWDLLCAVLGRNPITGEVVPRTADTMIGGFMKLIGQEEVWENIKRGNAVARAWAWFHGALAGVMAFVQQIPSLFVQALRSLVIEDIVQVPRAFGRIAGVFGGFALRFLTWAGEQVMSLLQIIFEVVAPQVMVYIRRAGGALQTIIRNPIGFVGNLINAGLLGLRQFASNFLTHLRASLIGWLTGAMSGANIYIPQAFSLQEIVKFILSVLGLTWQNIRQKLVRAVGESTVAGLETGFDLVVTLVREGPAAAWQKILEGISNLREMVMEQIMAFVQNRVVQAAITRLVTSLNPAGAFIQAIIATYNTIMFFVERFRQISQVVMAFIDSIASIASGVISAAANRVEQTMAGMLTLVISFLARIAGLGRVSDAVVNIINRVRQPIDRALDRVVDWIVTQARRLGRFVAQAGVPQDPNERLRMGMRAAIAAVQVLPGQRTEPLLNTGLAAVKIRYGFQVLQAIRRDNRWLIRGVVNPEEEKPIPEIPESDAGLLRLIRQVADQEIASSSSSNVRGAGTHEDPYVVPTSGGVMTVAHHLGGTQLSPGRIAVYDVSQGSPIPLRGVVQRPGFPRGDAIISGATSEERRIAIGSYPAIVQAMKNIGNDRVVASAVREILAGGEVPANLRGRAGWLGGFKVLVAQEIRRDPVAMATISANLEMAAEGRLSLERIFAGRTGTGTSVQGGLFSHSMSPALAPLRGVRERLGFTLPENAPMSRGTAEQRRAVVDRDRETIVEYVRSRLRISGHGLPPMSEIESLVRQAIRGLRP